MSFRFQQFSVDDSACAMKIGTDGVLIGAWAFDGVTRLGRVLDVGSGSGLVALMVAQRFPEAVVEGVDIDSDAVNQARENFARSPWSSRLTARQCDFLEFTPGGQFDAIVSNPPFFVTGETAPDARRALARHEGGLTVETLIRRASLLLSQGGRLALIAPAERLDELIYTGAINRLDASRVMMVRPTDKAQPYRVMVEMVKGLSSTYTVDEMTIRSHGSYTQSMRQLTDKFYL